MEREERYQVVKRSDVLSYLTDIERTQLAILHGVISEGRAKDGKRPLNCVCVEEDWPEYESVWQMLEARIGATDIPQFQPAGTAIKPE